jgi:hypothetical protein
MSQQNLSNGHNSSTNSNNNHHNNEPQEIEVMPGVFMTDFRNDKTKPSELTSEQSIDLNERIQQLQLEHQDLLSEFQLLKQEQVNQTQLLQKTTQHTTIYEKTGLTGLYLLEQIEIKIAELQNYHRLLISSQKQLEDLLITEDSDIIEAYEENKAVLIDQQERLKLLLDERDSVLHSMGDHYCSKENKPQLPQQPQIPQDEHKQQEVEESHKNNTNDGGFWL